jgi:hypothetical protein
MATAVVSAIGSRLFHPIVECFSGNTLSDTPNHDDGTKLPRLQPHAHQLRPSRNCFPSDDRRTDFITLDGIGNFEEVFPEIIQRPGEFRRFVLYRFRWPLAAFRKPNLGQLLTARLQMFGNRGPVRSRLLMLEVIFSPLDQLSDEALEKFSRSYTNSSICSRMCGTFLLA